MSLLWRGERYGETSYFDVALRARDFDVDRGADDRFLAVLRFWAVCFWAVRFWAVRFWADVFRADLDLGGLA
ncbi:MAG: hypothetical protein ABWZ42_10355 [Ilumatobacteraceae bacterium]